MLQLRLGVRKKILITGGAGFIGSALIRRLLLESSAKIFNLDKLGYAMVKDFMSLKISI